MPRPGNILLRALRDTEVLAQLRLADWDVLLREARATRLLGTLVVRADRLGISEQFPEQVAWHLESARVCERRQDQLLRFEVTCINRVLKKLQLPTVLLKAAAYRLADLPAATGRLSGDVDILVPRQKLARVEAELVAAGWLGAEIEPELERYFRRWLHELPPMINRFRGTKLDVHHNILPSIDRLQVDAQTLLDAAVEVDRGDGICVLAPTDMVLHNTAHLFRNGDYTMGLRDLVDLDALLRHFGKSPSFWDQLVDRAAQLKLGVPLSLGCRYASQLLDTPVPEATRQKIGRLEPWLPPVFLLDRLIPLAIRPPSWPRPTRLRGFAHWTLARYPLCLWRKTILPKVERLMLPARPK